jgi:hypothetical protein
LSNLDTVIIFGKESPKLFSAFIFDIFSIFFGFWIPGKIICIFDGSIPTLIANSFVKFEFAIIKSALFVLLINLLFNEDFIL